MQTRGGDPIDVAQAAAGTEKGDAASRQESETQGPADRTKHPTAGVDGGTRQETGGEAGTQAGVVAPARNFGERNLQENAGEGGSQNAEWGNQTTPPENEADENGETNRPSETTNGPQEGSNQLMELEVLESGTSGAVWEREDHPDLETTMHWSPAKRAGQKRGSEAIEHSATSSEDEDEEGSSSDGEEEGEVEKDEDVREEAEVEGGGPEGEGDQERTQDNRAVYGPATDHHERPQQWTGSLQENVGGNKGPWHTEVSSLRRRLDCYLPRNEDEAGPRRLSLGQGQGKPNDRKKNKGLVNAPFLKEVFTIERSCRKGKAQRCSELEEPPDDTDMEPVGVQAMRMEDRHEGRQGQGEVIPETQPLPLIGKGTMYKDILASIGLDSPTPSHDTRGMHHGEETSTQHANTPIRHSAASLIALGNHIFTPRQGRMWESRNRSPLGG